MLDVREILDCQSDLRNIRMLEEPQWREIATLIKPEDRDIGNRNERSRVADEIFDSTPLQALDQFEGGFFNQATNPAERWMELGLEDKDLAKWGPVKDFLWTLGTAVFASASPARSGFYVSAPGVFGDLGAFGLGTLYSAEKPGKNAFIDLAIPLSESYIDTDGMGNLTRFNREYPMTGRQMKAEFGEAAANVDDKRKVWVCHAVYKNPDYAMGKLGPNGMEWASTYCSADVRGFRLDKGYYEMPYHSVPWKLRSGRVWPIGPGHIARPDVNMLNEMERSHIIAAQYQAEPPVLLHDEGVFTAADLSPNAFLYGTLNADGKPLMQNFVRGGDVRLSMEQSQQRRAAIKEAFLFSMMQLVNRPQMTATEFLGFKQVQLEALAPNLSKVNTFLLAPWVARRVKMLQRMGLAPPAPPEMQGQHVLIEMVSPLAKAQKANIGRATMQWVAAVQQLAVADPMAADNIDADGVADVMHDSLGAPPSVQRSAKDIAKLRGNRAAAMQQNTQLAQAGQAATVAATAAHAAQAATLSTGRIAGPGGQGGQ